MEVIFFCSKVKIVFFFFFFEDFDVGLLSSVVAV